MKPINIRRGESLSLDLDTGDDTGVEAVLYVGRPGEQYLLSKSATVTDGRGVFLLSESDTQLPVGEYYFQVNVVDTEGSVSKYPSPDADCRGCKDSFPKIYICEALDDPEAP